MLRNSPSMCGAYMDCSVQVCHAEASSYITIHASRALWAIFLLSPIGAFHKVVTRLRKGHFVFLQISQLNSGRSTHVSLSATESYK